MTAPTSHSSADSQHVSPLVPISAVQHAANTQEAPNNLVSCQNIKKQHEIYPHLGHSHSHCNRYSRHTDGRKYPDTVVAVSTYSQSIEHNNADDDAGYIRTSSKFEPATAVEQPNAHAHAFAVSMPYCATHKSSHEATSVVGR